MGTASSSSKTTLGPVLALAVMSLCEPALAQSPATTPPAQLVLTSEAARPYPQVRAEVEELAVPAAAAPRRPTLAERPIVLDFRDEQSLTLGYRSRHDDRLEAVAVPAAPPLVFDVRSVRREAFADYRHRVFDDFEAGLRVPYLDLKETRPTRIFPAAPAPFFTTAEDVRDESGFGDLTLSLAHGNNDPRVSRRIGLDVKLDTASTSIPDAGSLPLGTGQRDYTLSYGLKHTRGSFALTGQAGVTLRDEGTITTFAGTRRLFDPGDEAFLIARADRSFDGWWTGSFVVEARAGERDRLDGASQPGSSRELLALTPVLTYQASEVLEVIAAATYPVVAHSVEDSPLFEVALRWRH